MKNTENNADVPNFPHALLLLAILIGLEGFVGIVLYSLGYIYEGGQPIGYVTVLVAVGIVTTLLMKYKNINYQQLFHFSKTSPKTTVLLVFIPLLFMCYGEYYLISDLENHFIHWFPMSNEEIEMFSRLIGTGLSSLIIVCIVAPFVEEILFRGLILRGFLNNYSVIKSIVLSAFLFALFHMNIYQFVSAFIGGCLLGWLYVKTHSLWPCVVYHAMFNITSYVFTQDDWINAANDVSVLEPEFNSVGTNILAALALVVSIFVIAKIFSLRKYPV